MPSLPAMPQAHLSQQYFSEHGVYVVCLQEHAALVPLGPLWQAEAAVPPTQHPPILLVLLPVHPDMIKKRNMYNLHIYVNQVGYDQGI